MPYERTCRCLSYPGWQSPNYRTLPERLSVAHAHEKETVILQHMVDNFDKTMRQPLITNALYVYASSFKSLLEKWYGERAQETYDRLAKEAAQDLAR